MLSKSFLGWPLVTILVACSIASAQDGFDEVEEVVEDVEPRNRFEIPEENFNQWIFGTPGGKQRLHSLLELRVGAIHEVCQLSEAQLAKLRLAGGGDIKRFMDGVEQVREKFIAIRHDQAKINEIWQEIQPFQARINSGFFDDTCLLRKVIASTLDTAQLARFEQFELDRREYRYRARVGLVVATLEQGMPLRASQRRRLVRLLISETRPPQRFGQHDYNVVMYRMARLPEEKLKPIFDTAQWRALTKELVKAGRLDSYLRREGVIE